MRPGRLPALLEASLDATIAVDVRGDIAEWNHAAEAMFGWARAEVLDTPMRSIVPSDGLSCFDADWKQLASGVTLTGFDTDRLHRDGTRVPVNVHAVAVRDEAGFAGTVATYRPQVGPAHPDGHDGGLAGLSRRRALQAALTASLPTGMARGVAVLDVDAFDLVNQTYGPDVGDDVLRQLGRRLDLGGTDCVVGRWQADEFVFVLDAPDARGTLEGLVHRARQAVQAPLAVGGQSLYLTASVGLVTSQDTGTCDLFSAACQALQGAKAGGRDRVRWFDPAVRSPASGELQLANDLRRGIHAGELRLRYQPILELTDNDVVGVEALVRWQRPGCALLAPAEFIDVAERTGQIVPLGAWVTTQACQSALRLPHLGNAPLSVSINLSARQVSDPGVVSMLGQALTASGCNPANVIIEVTETALLHDMPSAIATLHAIKALGVALALDDFGTGYSSLTYLKQLPVDRIKIDKSFVHGLGSDADDTAIVASTISLAHSVGVLAVAEGVETVDQLTLLRQMGCDFAQGFLFSAPLTLGRLQQWLAEHPPVRRRRARAVVPPVQPLETSRILRLHHEGASLRTIAAALNVAGGRTALSLRWSPQSVAKVIAQAEFPAIALPD